MTEFAEDVVSIETIHDVSLMLDVEHRDRDPNAYDVRAALMLIEKTRRERANLEITARQIAERYSERVAELLRREEQCRRMIEEWIVRSNAGQKVTFPDAGSAHLSSVRASIVIDADQEMVATVAAEFGCMKETPDIPKLKKVLLDRLAETGEAPPPGFELKEARKTVVVSV